MKNTIATFTLVFVLTFGATFANAGIIVTDRSANAAGIIVTDLSSNRASAACTSGARSGIILTDIFGTYSSVVGIIVTDLAGILVSDLSAGREGCSSATSVGRDGIIVTDRAVGIIVTD